MSERPDGDHVRFTLDDVPRQRRSKVWMDRLNAFFYDYDFHLASDFRDGRLNGFHAGELSVASVQSDAMSVYRNEAHIAHDGLDAYFVLLHNGSRMSLAQRGKETFVQDRQFALVSTIDPYVYVQDETTAFDNIIIPGKTMRHFAPHVDELVAEELLKSPVSFMFYELASSLCSSSEDLGKDAREVIARQVVELLGLSLDGADYGSEATPVRMGHRRRIMKLVEQNYADPTFNLEKIATRLKLSKRYIQAIFSDNDENITSIIRRRRIAEARLLLRKAKSSRSSVTEIAHSVGFVNLSHFSHVFKKETGHTPKDMIAGAENVGLVG